MSWDEDQKHAEKVRKKLARISGLQALLRSHESAASPDYQYMLELKERIRRAETQYKVMSDPVE